MILLYFCDSSLQVQNFAERSNMSVIFPKNWTIKGIF